MPEAITHEEPWRSVFEQLVPLLILRRGVVLHASDGAFDAFRLCLGLQLLERKCIWRFLPPACANPLKARLALITSKAPGPYWVDVRRPGAHDKYTPIRFSLLGIRWKERPACALSVSVGREATGQCLVPTPYPDTLDTKRVSVLARLSPREYEIASLAAEGFSIVNIATRLGLKEGTVRTHLRNCMRKVGAGSRADLVNMFPEAGS